MAKQSGYSALLESLNRTLQIPKNISDGAGGILGKLKGFGDFGARQTSRVINTGNWTFEKFPILASIGAVVLFWKPIKNTFSKLFGRHDDAQAMLPRQGVQTMRENSAYYKSNETGPKAGMSEKQWRNYVQAARGQYTGQDGGV